MNIKAKGSVTVPRTPRGLMDLLGWAKSVNSAIQQLRDRTWTAYSPASYQVEKEVQFQVKLSKDGGSDIAKITPGYVRFVNPKSEADPVIKDQMPEGMDDDPRPEHSVSPEDALYVKVVTDKRGEPTAITIEVAAIDVASIHSIPLPDTPEEVSKDGEYYYKIAEFFIEGETLKVKQFQIGGPILHVSELWEGKNVGDGEHSVYKQIEPTECTFDFRTLKQGGMETTGAVAVIKPPEDPVEDQIIFRSIAPRPSQMQINVEVSGDETVVIKGNDFDADIDLIGGGLLKIVDGLVESQTPSGIPESFTVEIWAGELTYYTGGSEIYWEKGSSPLFTIYFFKGAAHLTSPSGFDGTEVIKVSWITNE
jgi:hypothetical protein